MDAIESGAEEEVSAGRPYALPGSAPGIPAGLASLDVEIPLRGSVYRFTTPGGDVEITARAVPSKLVDNLIRAAAVLAGVIVLLLALRLARRGALSLLTTRLGSWCLILLGVLSLCIFPVLGLAAVVAGIAIKVRRAGALRNRLTPTAGRS